MKGNHIIIPKSLQAEVLKQVHTRHQGLYKCNKHARRAVWWPKMTAQFEKIKNCWICCKYRRPHAEPLKSSPLPNLPWQKVATDLFIWKQNSYLLVIDYYSCYIEVAKLYLTTSDSVIEQLKEIFARHGIPQTIVSDNGPNVPHHSLENSQPNTGLNTLQVLVTCLK